MGYWIELHCDAQKDGCESHSADNYGELVGSTVQNIIGIKRVMEATAKRFGWRRTKTGWICPKCSKTK